MPAAGPGCPGWARIACDTLATDVLRAGAGLAEVGQLLRHRNQLSTTVYAKVDHTALRTLARPWPLPARQGGMS